MLAVPLLVDERSFFAKLVAFEGEDEFAVRIEAKFATKVLQLGCGRDPPRGPR